MEGLLWNLLLLLIVFGVLFAVVRLVPWGEGWMKQAALIVLAGIFLILLIIRVLIPLLHAVPT